MSNVLKDKVLVLTKNFRPISFITVRKAIHQMATPRKKKPSQKVVTALEVENGQIVRLVPWEEWIDLPIRDGDKYIGTSNRRIRKPTIVTLAEFDRVHEIEPKFSKEALWRRQNGRDMYTGEKLEWNGCNIDHYIPRDRGGKTSFENCGLTRVEINEKKGNKLAHEVGLKLALPLTKPEKLLVSWRLQPDPAYPEWTPFLRFKG
jgi:5-methylcytosine-specific restriction endonuclease McrA